MPALESSSITEMPSYRAVAPHALADEEAKLEGGAEAVKHKLTFNVSYEINDKKILHNTFGDLTSGECLAIMGPSGGMLCYSFCSAVMYRR